MRFFVLPEIGNDQPKYVALLGPYQKKNSRQVTDKSLQVINPKCLFIFSF